LFAEKRKGPAAIGGRPQQRARRSVAESAEVRWRQDFANDQPAIASGAGKTGPNKHAFRVSGSGAAKGQECGSGAALHASDIESGSAFVEKIEHGMREVVRLRRSEPEGLQSAEDSDEVIEAGEQLENGGFGCSDCRRDRSAQGRADKSGSAGADAFDGFGAEACLFDIDAGG
jgi:hypothetical protein